MWQVACQCSFEVDLELWNLEGSRVFERETKVEWYVVYFLNRLNSNCCDSCYDQSEEAPCTFLVKCFISSPHPHPHPHLPIVRYWWFIDSSTWRIVLEEVAGMAGRQCRCQVCGARLNITPAFVKRREMNDILYNRRATKETEEEE